MKWFTFCTIVLLGKMLHAQTHTLTCQDIGIPPKDIPFRIDAVQISESVQPAVGLIQSRSSSKTQEVVLGKSPEKNIIEFLSKQLSYSNQPEIILVLTECRIAATEAGKSSVSDTFLFRCEFYKAPVNPENYLYTFKARNPMGSFDKAGDVVNNYYSRAILSAIDKFGISLSQHPEWVSSGLEEQKPVKVSVTLNPMKSADSIGCKKGFLLKANDYQSNDKDTSTKTVFTKMTLTYQLSATESSKELNLKIYPKAFFHKSRSWFKSTADWGLQLPYQQGIYDLCTAYGNKLAKAFKSANYSLGEYKSQINTIYNTVFNEYAEVRKTYQAETNEGMDLAQMALWRKKIDDLLEQSE